jgi:nucleotide-binding universal stress UspA family protein
VICVLGAALTFALWVASLFTHGAASIAGPVWLALGGVVYLLSRRAGGESLFGRATPPVPDLVPYEPNVHHRILVPLKMGEIGEEVLATAIRYAEENGAEVHVVHVLRVPMSMPLDGALDEKEAGALADIADAREIAQEHGVEVEARVVRARSISEAIVAEAAATGAGLIILGSAPRWRTQSRFFSPTVDEVLRRAPCEVMVVTFPDGVLAEPEGA